MRRRDQACCGSYRTYADRFLADKDVKEARRQSIETRENQRREGRSRSQPWVIAQDRRVRSGLEAAKRVSCNSNLHNSRAGATHGSGPFIFGGQKFRVKRILGETKVHD